MREDDSVSVAASDGASGPLLSAIAGGTPTASVTIATTPAAPTPRRNTPITFTEIPQAVVADSPKVSSRWARFSGFRGPEGPQKGTPPAPEEVGEGSVGRIHQLIREGKVQAEKIGSSCQQLVSEYLLVEAKTPNVSLHLARVDADADDHRRPERFPLALCSSGTLLFHLGIS